MMASPTIQDIFLEFYPQYLKKYQPSFDQHRAANAIMNCKTGRLGANVSVCEECGTIALHYNSCRNRCCPMCQSIQKEKWIDLRREDVLDAPYFHMVFTVPHELNPLIYNNQRLLYDALYHASSETIEQLAAQEKHLGAKVGYICILHTWGSELNFHPHIHTILLGGGLSRDFKWKDKGEKFFLPIKIISRVFRGKYLEKIRKLFESGKLNFTGSASRYRGYYAFKELLDHLYAKEWQLYCKKTFNGAQSVIKYLGKYTHRIAISNHRIKCIKNGNVVFAVKDYRNQGKWKDMSLSGVEFIRRFLMHVPPKRFVRVRHYGLLCSRTKRKDLQLCRRLLGSRQYHSKLRDLNAVQIIETIWNVKVNVCRHCGCEGRMIAYGKMIPLRC